MKKRVIILITLAFIAGSCRHATKKQTATTNNCQGDTLIKLSDTHGILFRYYDTELELWYKPCIVDFRSNDTMIIQNLVYENGSELDIRVSPNKKYAVLDNIIKGYVAQELHENYQCVLIDIDNAILLDTWQSACGGEWDKNNHWISGGETLFPFIKTSENEELSEMETEELLTYRGLTLIEAYPKFLKDKPEIGKHLLKIFSDTTYISNVDEENVEIIYRPLVDEDGLFIELLYSGGVTTVNFKYGNNDIRVRIVYSPD